MPAVVTSMWQDLKELQCALNESLSCQVEDGSFIVVTDVDGNRSRPFEISTVSPSTAIRGELARGGGDYYDDDFFW